jgi:plastocyanin
MMLIENRIRWSGLLIVLGLAVLLFSLRWSHPLSFMAFLVLGCPLIFGGILLFLWALAMKDGPGSSALWIVGILLLPLIVSACGAESNNPAPGRSPQAFDPATATARVFGTVSLEGTKPGLGSVTIRQDQFCQKNGQAILKRGALVTEDGTLRNVIVYVRSGYAGRTYAVPAEPVVLDQQECVYVPHVLTLMKGQKLRILNSDPTFHNVHAQADGSTEFNIPQPSKGIESIQTFSRAAMPPFRIGCDFHNWMVSYAGVFEHPFHMATGDSGKFELRLPPGKYEIVAWHEKFGEQAATVDASPDGATELNFKFPSSL